MKALLLPPLEPAAEAMLDERCRLGLDGRDEMWDGVLHVVPPPGGPHQRLSTVLDVTGGAPEVRPDRCCDLSCCRARPPCTAGR